jgi:hypothetical protein
MFVLEWGPFRAGKVLWGQVLALVRKRMHMIVVHGKYVELECDAMAAG